MAALPLADQRRRQRLDQAETAAYAHLSAATYRAIEEGRRVAWPEARQRIARALRVGVDEIAWPDRPPE